VIAEELRGVTDHVGQVRDAAQVIDRSIAGTDQATAAVVEQARQAERVISSLDRSLRRVASTAALVTGIAGQTRLLALNATIEAAWAGELGSGFTVVADEVKELATSTAHSTEQITTAIDELERDTAEMAHAITTMIEGIGGIGEGDAVGVELSNGDDRIDLHATVMNSAEGADPGEVEVGLQFLITDGGLADRLDAFVGSLGA
jgi:methyl-accepting chemotaxis protein